MSRQKILSYKQMRQVGTRKTKQNNGTYDAEFTGNVWLDTAYDEGTFLTDMPTKEYNAQFDNESDNPPDIAYPRRMDLAALFPDKWLGSKIAYSIAIKAKKL